MNRPQTLYLGPGQKLRATRNRLCLQPGDVISLTTALASRHHNQGFLIAAARLHEIESGEKFPTIYELYAICTVYLLPFPLLLEWYGIPAECDLSESRLV